MRKLPRDLKPKKLLKALQQAGFEIDHITGSPYILRKDKLRTSVPYHQVIKTGTLRAILNQCDLSVEEFTKML
jgi:predicted RNA binding protein YcfA (HicA-like mRNA interferase family)